MHSLDISFMVIWYMPKIKKYIQQYYYIEEKKIETK